MEQQKETHLKNFIQAIKGSNPPASLPGETLNTNRELFNFDANMKSWYAEFNDLKVRSNGDNAELIKLLLTHLKILKKKPTYAEGFIVITSFFQHFDYDKLSAALQDKWNKGIEILEKRIDYFCSYTRKGLPDINSLYEQIIYKTFNVKQDTHPKEWETVNYVAKLVVRYLADHPFSKYFFDMDSIKNGEEIKEQVFDFCGRTTVLILLAQQEAFRYDPNDGNFKNWCFEEYKHYSNTHDSKKFLVFKVPGLVVPEDASQELVDWYNYMTTAEGVKGPTIDFDCGQNKLRGFVNDAAAEIRKAKEDEFNRLICTF